MKGHFAVPFFFAQTLTTTVSRHFALCDAYGTVQKTSFHMLKLDHVDLRTDPVGPSFVKNEQVDVIMAKTDGQLFSREATAL